MLVISVLFLFIRNLANCVPSSSYTFHNLVKNDTAKNRALNRRVELIIVQGEEEDQVNEISADSTNPFKNKLDNNEQLTAEEWDEYLKTP